MGKAAEAHERGVELILTAGGSTAVTGLAVQDLVTILGNLLDNAIDAAADGAAAPPRGTVGRSGRRSPGDLGARTAVPDIDPDAVDDVFRHGFSTKAPGPFGRGLGLALVRQAVQRLGGSMSITSPAGALFKVTLPTEPAAAAGSEEGPERGAEQAPAGTAEE